MSDPSIVETLRGVAFFRDIADEHLQQVAEIARPEEFPARTEIFREHEKAKDIYIIISGRVSLVICQPKVGCRQLTEAGGGDLVGWSPLVGRARLSDTAYTLEPTKALAVDGDQMLMLCKENPEFGFEFMQRAAQVLAERLSATRLTLLELSGNSLPDIPIESD